MTWVGMEETLDLRWGSSVFSFYWHPKVMPRNHPAFLCQLFIPFCSLHNSSPTGSTSRKTTEIPARLAARSSIWLKMSRILEALFYMSSVGNCAILFSICLIFTIFGLVQACPCWWWPMSKWPFSIFPLSLSQYSHQHWDSQLSDTSCD